MDHVGYSLIDSVGTEITVFSDRDQQIPIMPSRVDLPNGDIVLCPALGAISETYRLVGRYRDGLGNIVLK